MTEEGAVLAGALEPEAFFGRVAELQRLRHEARSLLRGRGRSRAIFGRPGSGKTELLLQWHGTLFREGEVLPLYYAVGAGRDAGAVAADWARRIALQALAFAKRDPSLLLRPPSSEEVAGGLRSAFGGAGGVLSEGLLRAGGGPAALDVEGAALLPSRLSLAAGIRVICMLDDAGNLLADDRAIPLPQAAAATASAPLLLAVERESEVDALLGCGSASVASLERLAPLGTDAVRQMARSLARIAGLQLGEETISALEREAAGNPFYLAALVRTLHERGGTGPRDVARAAAAATCDGELGRYWLERLAAHLPARHLRATAIEILAFCLREEGDALEAGRLAARMLKSREEVEAALEALRRAGVVRLDCSRITVDEDPVFRDAVLALYRREFEGAPPAAVTAACAAAKVRDAGVAARRRAVERFRESLGALLLRWDGQRVPRELFDAPAFARRSAPGAVSLTNAEGATDVTLPQVVSVASGRVGATGSPAACDLDVVAWAVRVEPGIQDADVAWVARRIAGGAGSAAQLAALDRQIAALQGAGDLPAERVVRWALLDAPLDGEGERAAARLRVMTSDRAQLAGLAEALGLAAPVWPEAREIWTAPALEMEMVIPRASDAELVAARALEQLAENVGMSPEDAGRVKTALVEACINAFEHSGDREGRVRLWFAVGGGKLVIRVENRGRALAALPPPSTGGEQPRRRGWGLTLIRQLIDEVRIEPREDGVSLVMEKTLGGQSHG
jgi:serine/threonine-protein kinase RsbW